MSNATNGGRVTTREFYDALLNQNKERSEMERRLGTKIDGISLSIAKIDSMDKRIDENSSEIKKVRNLNTGIALLASTIAGILGVNK